MSENESKPKNRYNHKLPVDVPGGACTISVKAVDKMSLGNVIDRAVVQLQALKTANGVDTPSTN